MYEKLTFTVYKLSSQQPQKKNLPIASGIVCEPYGIILSHLVKESLYQISEFQLPKCRHLVSFEMIQCTGGTCMALADLTQNF